MAQTFSPTDTYGSNAVKNRVRPGGTLGSNQYYYTTNALTGEVTVNRYVINRRGRNTDVEVGTIPQGGVFTPNSTANDAEKTHYGSSSELGRARAQALQVARREWDGRTSPPPTQAIYGTNAINAAYDPANVGTRNTSIKNTQTASEDLISGIGKKLLGGIGKSKRTSSTKVLIYPKTLRQNNQDYIKITKLEYKPSGVTEKNISGVGGNVKDRISLEGRASRGSVILPIPGGIQSTDSASWGGEKMDPLQAAAANLALAGIEDLGKMGETLGGLAETAGKSNKEIKDAIAKAVAGQASGTGAQLMSRTEGKIVNPNMELLFKDPSLRPFNFTFKLAPRSRDEAQEVIKIIRFFKEGMAPTKSEANLFLQAPHTWMVSYNHRGKDHKYLNKFKECAMTSFTTSFTPDGNYATFEDGVMTSYQITMALQELEPIFSNDYEGVDGIGY